MKKTLLSIATAAVLFPAALPGQAQAQSLLTLEEVIVTAQRREESLQDTPISVSAFNAEALQAQGITSLDDLQGKVPSLNMTPFPTQQTSLRMFIRGVGASDIQVTQDPAVGVYIDDVYIGRATGLALDIIDLKQIEVLRGPQGTLFGRNSIGGAINMRTVGAELDQLSFRQEFTTGDRDLWRSKTALNVPLGDNAAARIAYLDGEQDGWVNNDGPGRDWYDRKDEGGKVDLQWQPSDSLSLSYCYDWTDAEMATPTFQVLVGSPITGQFGMPVSKDPLGKLNSQDPVRDAKTEVEGHSLTIEWERGDILLKSITAYRELKYTEYTDLDSGAGTAGPVLLPFNVTGTGGINVIGHPPILDQEQWSQEFQLIGDFGDNFDYVGGVYYFLEEATKESGSQFTVFFPQPAQEEYFDIENEAWAIYGQGTYVPDFNEDLTFTLGLRYTEDDRQASLLRIIDGEAAIDADPDDDFQNLSYTAVVNYSWDDDINTYAKLATGYKSGGYNIRSSSAESYSQGFDEEELTTLELGLKSTWMNGRLRANIAAYYSEYDDIQLNLADITTPEDPTDTNVFNAGEAEIYGMEADFNMVLVEGLVASVSYAYQDAEFTNVDDPGDPANDEDNFVVSNAPEHQYTLGLDYNRELPIGALSASLNYNWVDDRYDTQRAAEARQTTIESYGLLGARLAWSGIEMFNGQLTLAAWGRNLTDEEYQTAAPVILQPAGAYERIATFGEPRSWGFDLVYEFTR